MWAKLIGLSALLVSSSALAQSLGPREADVILECFYNGSKQALCDFACGAKFTQAPGQEEMRWTNVSRVEFFHGSERGRADTRTWVFVASKAGPTSGRAVTALYFGPSHHCETDQLIEQPDGKVIKELRFTKFNF